MVYFGKFWKAWEWKISFMTILYTYVVLICFILWQFGIFSDNLFYFPHFGNLHEEKSGNPVGLCK
jgi:hypothetical protein